MPFNPKAPPVYKPTSSKVATPPVYRPGQSASRGVQPKAANKFALESRPAPAVYRPHIGQGIGSSVSRNSAQPPRPFIAKAPLLQARANVEPAFKPRVVSTLVPLPHRVLQRMQSSASDEVEMRSQFTGPVSVDLNCGRYCTEAAIKWWAEKLHLNLGDIFHDLLPEPTPKGPLGSLKIGWSPGNEGKNLTMALDIPQTLLDWQDNLRTFGPLIISGELGDAIIVWVKHFILVIDVDIARNELICKDPLKGNETVHHDFDWIKKRITSVYAVRPNKLQ
jgi:hypothetical protein